MQKKIQISPVAKQNVHAMKLLTFHGTFYYITQITF